MTTQPTNESGELPPMTKDNEQIEVTQDRPCIDIERNIRVAIWNTCCWQGKPQEVAQSFIRHAMAEPTMVRALDAIDASLSTRPSTDVLVEALERTKKFLRNEDGHGFGTQDMEGSEFFRQAGLLCDKIDQALTTYRETGA